MSSRFLENVIVPGVPCPFTRDPHTNSHPKAAYETFGDRKVLVCRHCSVELASQPCLPLVMEPRVDPRVRMAEKDAE